MTSLPNYALKGLLNLSLTHTNLHPLLQPIIDFAFHYFLALKYSQKSIMNY